MTHCQYSPLSPFPFYKDKQRDQKLYLLKVYYRLHLNYCLSQSYNSASLCISSDRNTVLSPFWNHRRWCASLSLSVTLFQENRLTVGKEPHICFMQWKSKCVFPLSFHFSLHSLLFSLCPFSPIFGSPILLTIFILQRKTGEPILSSFYSELSLVPPFWSKPQRPILTHCIFCKIKYTDVCDYILEFYGLCLILLAYSSFPLRLKTQWPARHE